MAAPALGRRPFLLQLDSDASALCEPPELSHLVDVKDNALAKRGWHAVLSGESQGFGGKSRAGRSSANAG